MDRIIATQRLSLRPCVRTDKSFLHALWTHPEVRKYLLDDIIIPPEQVDGFIAKSLGSFERHGAGLWTMSDIVSGELAGVCGLWPVDDTGEIEILYSILPAWWGKGLVHEAARAVLEFGFENAGLDRIIGRTDAPNTRSIRVLERLGMTFTGKQPGPVHSAMCYAIDQERFQQSADITGLPRP